MLIEIALALACVVFVAIITRENGKRKNKPSANATHPLADDKHSNASYLKAREQYNNKRYKDALHDIDNALDLQPECKNCLWLRAEIFISLGQYKEAIIDCDELLSIDNSYSWGYATRGNAYLLSGNYEDSLEDLEHALLLNPSLDRANFNRLRVYNVLGKYEVADAIEKELSKKSIAKDKIKWELALLLSCSDVKRYDRALEHGNKIIGSQQFSEIPDEAQYILYHKIITAYSNVEKYNEALEICDKMYKLSFTDVKVYQIYSHILEQKLNFKEAKLFYEEGLEKYPEDKYLLSSYSRLMRIMGLYKQGLKTSNKLINLYPDDADYIHIRGLHYLGLNELDNSLTDLIKAIELNPNEVITYINLSIVYRRLKDFDKALENDAKIIDIDEQKGLSSRINTFTHLEQYDDAIRDLDRLIEIAPDNAQTYNNRAWYKSYTGDYKGALLDIEKAILLDNTQGTFFSTRGQVNWLMKNYNEALADFTKAIELSPNTDIHMFEIAIALTKLNQRTDAIELWQEATSEDAEFQSAEAYQGKYRFALPFYEAMQSLEKLAQNTD